MYTHGGHILLSINELIIYIYIWHILTSMHELIIYTYIYNNILFFKIIKLCKDKYAITSFKIEIIRVGNYCFRRMKIQIIFY